MNKGQCAHRIAFWAVCMCVCQSGGIGQTLSSTTAGPGSYFTNDSWQPKVCTYVGRYVGR